MSALGNTASSNPHTHTGKIFIHATLTVATEDGGVSLKELHHALCSTVYNVSTYEGGCVCVTERECE